MKSGKIFRWIWRLNAVAFMVCSLVFISAFFVAIFPTVKDYLLRKPIYRADNMVNVEQDANINSEWTLGGFRKIGNNGFMISPVYAKQEYNVGLGSGKEAASTRNYLFLNSVDKATRWLVPTNKYLFLDEDDVKEGNDNNGKLLALEYRLVTADSNNDGRLTQTDKKTFGMSGLDGADFTELVNGIDEFLSDEQPGPDTLLLIYRSDAKNLVTEIKISEKKVMQTKELPKIDG